MSNTNFAAIGQLVTEARNLLDSIKGGAIRAMQTQFDELKKTFSDNGNAAIFKIKSDARSAIAQVSTSQAMLNSIGFTALNINDDFSEWVSMTNSRGELQEWPLYTAFYNDSAKHGRNLLTPSKIEVKSGMEVSERPAVVRELIRFAGFGGKYFPRGGFNILKLSASGSSKGLNIQLGFGQHSVESYSRLTFMGYLRSPGSNNQWERKRMILEPMLDGYGYTFPNFNLSFESGDEIYIALPTLTAGIWPVGIMHGLLPNESNARHLANK